MNRIYFLSSLPLIAVDLEKVEAISEDWVMFGAGKISTGGEKNAYDLRRVWMAYHSEKKNGFTDHGKSLIHQVKLASDRIVSLENDCEHWYNKAKELQVRINELEQGLFLV